MRLIIIGAGGFGREVLAWAEHACKAGSIEPEGEWTIGGFLDNNLEALSGFETGYPILSSIAEYSPGPDDWFVIAMGRPDVRLNLAQDLESRGFRFARLIHPTAIVGPRVKVGHGSILCPFSVVTADVTIGSHVILNVHSTVGHDSTVGSGCTVNGFAEVTGRCGIGMGVHMGTHASVIPGCKVGDFAVIGAGSTVIKNVPCRATVFGVPATRLFDAGE
ncbi:MAG: acetyltransferase [Fimbriimonas sp.]|nr:acetyltransferase [Fimbriimonas sp.]